MDVGPAMLAQVLQDDLECGLVFRCKYDSLNRDVSLPNRKILQLLELTRYRASLITNSRLGEYETSGWCVRGLHSLKPRRLHAIL
jgi:hypothetical protein